MTNQPPPSRWHRPLKPGADMYGIQRREPTLTGTGGCWLVVVWRCGEHYDHSFADAAYRTPERALLAAQAFRDALLDRLPTSGRFVVRGKAKEGISQPGIHRRLKQGHLYWEATFQLNGKKRTKSFSIDKYGSDEAYRLAVQTRTAWETEHGVGSKAKALPAKEEVERLAQSIHERFGAGPRNRRKLRATYNDEPMYGIYRYERNVAGKGGHWTVLIKRRNARYGKTFSDASHGGKESALEAARAYRDAILSSVEPLPLRDRHRILSKGNTSGVPGVNLKKKNGQPDCWRAFIMIQGQRRYRHFSIHQYGFERAFELAVQAREAMIEEVGDGYFVLSPAAKGNR